MLGEEVALRVWLQSASCLVFRRFYDERLSFC
jgi:hypothetical protein